MKIEAKLLPLKGKYYGTRIDAISDNSQAGITVWAHKDSNPSDRELAQCGYTREQWDANSLVNDGSGGSALIYDLDLFIDDHFETQKDYELALELVKRINKE